MNQPSKYTAVLTTYNASSSVSEALNSILFQDPSAAEIIVVDDQSTDETLSILQNFQVNNPNLKIFQNEFNSGQSFSRNFAVNHALFERIIFFDDDDISLSNRASIHLNMFDSGSDINYVSSEKVYPNHYQVPATNELFGPIRLDLMSAADYLLLGKRVSDPRYFVPSSTLAISKKAFNSIGGFDTQLRRVEDIDLAIRAVENRLKFAFSDSVGVIRKFSVGEDKGSGVEATFEEMILQKHARLLSNFDIQIAMSWKTVRSLYFKGKFLQLSLFFISNPRVWIQSFRRINRVVNRLFHDWRK